MSKGNHKAKGQKFPSKILVEAYSPIGMPRSAGCKRYSLSCMGIAEILSGRGGGTNAR